MLVGRISKEEIKEVVWNCDKSKSPGPDGFNFGFLNFFWEEFKGNIIGVVKNFEEGGRWPKGANASFITLVLKCENPQQLNEFKLISLVGSMYKIVTKILSTRLKKVLNKVIDQRQ